ncbi:MAG: toxin-antitoxin system YwqK family antitoxin [Bacteroidia bacterium]
MKTKFILMLLFSTGIGLTAFGQNPVDTGFTVKAEARNVLVSGLKEGKWIEYEDTVKGIHPTRNSNTAPLYRLAVYHFGKEHGIVRQYWRNGKLYSEITFMNGVENGEAKFYNDNGSLKVEYLYANGKKNGEGKEYDKNGKIKSETTYRNDRPEKTKYFDENGNEIRK